MSDFNSIYFPSGCFDIEVGFEEPSWLELYSISWKLST